jgi:putative hydrolase of the HAD superfamily
MATAPVEPCSVQLILFDFGGVIAEEGFRNGLAGIAAQYGQDPAVVVKAGFELIYQVGYVLGKSHESAFWQALREATGIRGPDAELRREILSRFVLRPWMVDIIQRLNDLGVRLAIVSDQTDWLDELNRRDGFFQWFEQVFNSYHLGKSKKDPSLFHDVLAAMRVPPARALFVDDHPSNVARAQQQGLHAICYRDRTGFVEELATFCPALREWLKAMDLPGSAHCPFK